MKRLIMTGTILVLVVVGIVIGILIYRHPVQHTMTFENVALVKTDSWTPEQSSEFQRNTATVTLELTEYRFLFSPTVFAGNITVNDKKYMVYRPYNDRGIPDFFEKFSYNLSEKQEQSQDAVFWVASVASLMSPSSSDSEPETQDFVDLFLAKDFESFCLCEHLHENVEHKKELKQRNYYAYPARTEAEADELLSMVKY